MDAHARFYTTLLHSCCPPPPFSSRCYWCALSYPLYCTLLLESSFPRFCVYAVCTSRLEPLVRSLGVGVRCLGLVPMSTDTEFPSDEPSSSGSSTSALAHALLQSWGNTIPSSVRDRQHMTLVLDPTISEYFGLCWSMARPQRWHGG